MTPIPQPNWIRLEGSYAKPLVVALRRAFMSGSVSFTAAELANQVEMDDGTLPTDDEALALLEAAGSWLEPLEIWQCPHCHHEVKRADIDGDLCPACDLALSEFDEWDPEDQPQLRFVYRGVRGRDAHWILVLHGMNTDGAWQERFNWLVARTYGRSVPVAIYKYGKVRPGALIPALQRRHRDRLAERIRRFAFEVEEIGLPSKPDVIAHSFGTWLLGHALQKHPDLRVGRVILTGCILKPDFDWGGLEKRNQVEAILNHYGTEDGWARFARYAIPDSGPSGYRGMRFDPQQWRPERQAAEKRVAFNIPQVGFEHSDFFKVDERPVDERRCQPMPELDVLGRVFEEAWRPFLTNSLEKFRKRHDLG
ncbi:MAG: alpha/beta hydrolase [bacterium]|nr:alpha/beta hydrolase [bacterium]